MVNNTVFHRRRAERFAQLLAAAPGTRLPSNSSRDAELGEYVELSRRLRQTAHPAEATPDDAFRTSLRAMLVATATREGIGRTAAGATPALGRVGITQPESETEAVPIQVGLRSRRARGAIVVGLAASTLALSGISVASGDATPTGGPLRATEQVQLAETTSDILRGQLYLQFASSRADEVRAGRHSAAELTALLGYMDSQTQQGVRLLAGWAATRHDPRALADIDAWLPDQRDRLAGLETGVLARRVERSLTLLSQVRDRSTALRAALSCGAITEHSDDLGPIPGSCPSPSSTGGNGTSGNGAHGSHPSSTGTGGGTGSSSGSLRPSIPTQTQSPTAQPKPTAGPSTQPTGAPPLVPPSIPLSR